MSDSYLDLAHYVLEARGRPMSAQEILVDATKFGLIPTHLAGATMHKTLQARITEDIHANRQKSKFYRTSRGTYFLRSLSKDKTVVAKTLKEIPPPGRRRPLPKERVLHFDARHLEKIVCSDGYVSQDSLELLDTSYLVVPTEGWVPACVFVVIKNDQKFLSHVVGKHSYFTDLVGQSTIGFRAYIDEFDFDLFSQDAFGLPSSAVRELLRHFDILEDGRSLSGVEITKNVQVSRWAFDGERSRLAAIAYLSLNPALAYDFRVRRCLDTNHVSWSNALETASGPIDELSGLILGGVSF